MSHGVTFGSYHTSKNLGLSMSEYAPDVGTAEIVERYIEVPGGFFIDASEYSADGITYTQRHMTFRFVRKNNDQSWATTVSNVANAIHGGKMDIVLDDDPAWKYNGRVKVMAPEVTKPTTILPIEVVALPYKEYRRNLKNAWVWDLTDFDNDTCLYDTGLTNISIETSTYTLSLPFSPCSPTVGITLEVTGFYGSNTSGRLSTTGLKGNVSELITATGTYTYSVPVRDRKGSVNTVGISTTGLVGTLTVDYTPRSL